VSGYPYISQIQDPATQKAVKAAFDLLSSLSNRLDTLEASAIRNTAAINANGQRLAQVGNPTAEQDAVTVAFMRAYVSAQLESFKGSFGIDATIDTSLAIIITVKNGLIVSVV
jgi:ferritin